MYGVCVYLCVVDVSTYVCVYVAMDVCVCVYDVCVDVCTLCVFCRMCVYVWCMI